MSQPAIEPGKTFAYEFTLKQHGTPMYHSHGDEMLQIGLGSMGFFIVYPRKRTERIDCDYAIFQNEWFVPPGSARADPNVMTAFNIFTFNSRAYPGTAPLVARTGERVRLRFGNVGQESHPIHLHGYTFNMVATDGGDIPESVRWPETTVAVFSGQTRDVEFTAIAGDWAKHRHRRHHPMNAMGHDIPNLLGVDQAGVEEKIRALLPGYMAMGQHGMHEMTQMHMEGPENTLPMMAGEGPFGPVGMGGIFTILKVRDRLDQNAAAGWYDNPKGTVAYRVDGPEGPQGVMEYVCPMHPEVGRAQPGDCPECGMKLKLMKKESGEHQHHC